MFPDFEWGFQIPKVILLDLSGNENGDRRFESVQRCRKTFVPHRGLHPTFSEQQARPEAILFMGQSSKRKWLCGCTSSCFQTCKIYIFLFLKKGAMIRGQKSCRAKRYVGMCMKGQPIYRYVHIPLEQTQVCARTSVLVRFWYKDTPAPRTYFGSSHALFQN